MIRTRKQVRMYSSHVIRTRKQVKMCSSHVIRTRIQTDEDVLLSRDQDKETGEDVL